MAVTYLSVLDHVNHRVLPLVLVVLLCVMSEGCRTQVNVDCLDGDAGFRVSLNDQVGIDELGIWIQYQERPIWYLRTEQSKIFPFQIEILRWGEVPAGMRQLIPEGSVRPNLPKIDDIVLFTLEGRDTSPLRWGAIDKRYWFKMTQDGFKLLESAPTYWFPSWRPEYKLPYPE